MKMPKGYHEAGWSGTAGRYVMVPRFSDFLRRHPMSTEFEYVRYEGVEDGVARIALARADKRNAQNKSMLYELNDALDMAAQDDDCRVIVLAADGPDFSSGHDMKDREPLTRKPVGTWGGFGQPGIEGHWSFEEELYLGFCWRWRNIPKPTMVEVQGRVIAGGLMLVWPFDIIVASEDARFSDPVVAFGVNGVEYFAHPWEVGVRKAKEMLFTGEALTAEECKALGMVNHVVPRDDLTDFTMKMARHIARQPHGWPEAGQTIRQSDAGCPGSVAVTAGSDVASAHGACARATAP